MKALLDRLLQPLSAAPGATAEPATHLVQRIRRNAESLRGLAFLHLRYPDRREDVLTYDGLVELAGRWGALYRSRGLRPGQRVVVILPHSRDLYAAYLGAMLGDLVPSYFAHPSPKHSRAEFFATLNRLVSAAGAAAVVLYPELAGQIKGGELAAGVMRIVAGEEILPAGEADRESPQADPEATALVQFSSGTTGLKKGIEISHRALFWQIDTYARVIGLNRDDRIASWLPLYHDMGLMSCWLMPLLHGVPIVALSPFDWVRKPEQFLHAISEHCASLCWLPNFAYRFLADRVADDAIRGVSLHSLRGVVNCSEPVRATSHERFLQRFAAYGLRREALCASYAMAENVFAVTSGGFDRPPAVIDVAPLDLVNAAEIRLQQGAGGLRLVSSGRPLPQTLVAVLDDAGNALPEGRVGELAVASPGLFQGYLHNPDLTAQRLQRHGFATGDRGFVWRNEVFVLGRSEDTIIVAGKNVHPQDIEEVVLEVDGVLPGRCVVVGVPDEDLGTEALVVIAESHRTGVDADALLRAIHRTVASRTDVMPADVAIVPHMWLRKSTSGKLSRRINRERYLKREHRQAWPRPAFPAAADGEDLRATVRDCLRQAMPSDSAATVLADLADDAPLLVGGVIDSLGLVSLFSAMEKALGRALPQDALVHPERYDSIAGLAAAIAVLPAPTPAPAGNASIASRRNQLLPQFADVDRQPYEWVSYLMRRGAAGFRSPSLNTDRCGFRLGWQDGRAFGIDEFLSMPGPRGLVLGNSVAFGIGTSHDRHSLANQLNQRSLPPAVCWFSLALRASSLTQERLAAELHAPDSFSHVVWMSGVNTLVAALLGGGDTTNPAPYVGEWMFRKLVGAGSPARGQDIAAAYPDLVRQLRRDLEVAGAWLARRSARRLFLMQPVLAWIDKELSAEERELVALFDGSPQAVQCAHGPERLGPWKERFLADLGSACSTAGFDFIDLNAEPRFREPVWLFADRTHLTDRGQALIAEVVESWLSEA
ncbi:MAG: AMP-binding protein [Rhodocyclales bacterium]|nr:AMP-binding protein [Rhodocyclales bacterium]